MRQYKNKSWQVVVNGGIDGKVSLFGVNIFDYEWINMGKRAELNLGNHCSKMAEVYKVYIDEKEYIFAATEVRMAVWIFAVYMY